MPLCANADAYDSFKAMLCSFVDVSTAGDSPDAACDGLSGGSLIQARQARLGGVGPSAANPFAFCAPGVKPDIDHCY
jgi:hypothetical protein